MVLNKDFERFKQYVMYKHNSKKEIDRFKEAIDKKDNRSIENTLVVRTLDWILDSENNPFNIEIEPGEIIYRARVIDKDTISKNGMKGYDVYGSKEPPLGVSAEGRNNTFGVSYLYAADNENTACKECRAEKGSYISIARFKTVKKLQCIDFKTDRRLTDSLIIRKYEEEYNVSLAGLMTQIMWLFTKPVGEDEKQNYKSSQYIAEYLRKNGIDVIKYESSCSDGTNYTIFSCGRKYIEFIDSKVIQI